MVESLLDVVRVLLEHGACIETKWETSDTDTPLEQVLNARFKNSTRAVDLVTKGLVLSIRIPLILELMTLYLKFLALNRMDSLPMLRELVQEIKRKQLRAWAKPYHVFLVGLVYAKSARKLQAMGDLPTYVLQKVIRGDMQALVVIMTFTGMEPKFTAVQHRYWAAITQ
ncbi:ankyrin repeat protein [Penicillium nucicola]|uniref:ankyrin repeat protein n=1 Tax=Penicillium nucicola TaxID=1850975 RepID=UPI0025453410|nr:ankyrin repeat protein [Penicillium nucicola]KAJ5742633.1 ankyrin repeat protein [Penicillium nucicola]